MLLNSVYKNLLDVPVQVHYGWRLTFKSSLCIDEENLFLSVVLRDFCLVQVHYG